MSWAIGAPSINPETADVIVFKEGDYAVAVKAKTREIIAKSRDHAAFWNGLVNRLVNDGYTAVKICGSGVFQITDDVILQKNGVVLEIEGTAPPTNASEYGYVAPSNLKFVLKDDARLKDDEENWSRIYLKNAIIEVQGTYTKTPLYFPKTLLYMHNVQLNAFHTAELSQPHLLVGGSGGPPGIPVYWKMVSVNDSRKSGSNQYTLLLYLWYEGFMWNGGNITINLHEDIGWLSFLKLAGNYWGVFRNIDMFVSTVGNNKYTDFWNVAVPSRFENVALLDPDYIVYYHITSDSDKPVPVYIDTCRLHDAGAIVVPKINTDKIIPIYGLPYKRAGVTAFSGDGTTTRFKVEHGLVSTPSKVIVTPLSADAKDFAYAEADDTYIYFNFDTAPPAGTDNVKLSWYAEV